MLLADFAHDVDHVGGRTRGMDMGAGAHRLLSELGQEGIQLIGNMRLDALEFDPKLLEVDLFDRAVARTAPVLLVGANVAGEIGVVQRLFVALVEGDIVFELFDALVEGGMDHPNNSSTKSTATLPGPCTPTVNDISISAVRLGPVQSEA